MKFLAAALLPFLALAAVPILIHLLTRRRRRVVPWAAMDFLLAILRRHQRRMQMRDLILMALRALAIGLLAFAAARPSVLSRVFRRLGAGADLGVALVLDNSLSMKHATPAGTRFAAAQTAARRIADALPPGAAATLFLASDRVENVIPEPTRDLAVLLDHLARATPSDGGSSVLAGLRRAWQALDRRAGEREIYFLSDMQAGAWPRPEADDLRVLLQTLGSARPRPRLYFVDVGDGETRNVSVEDAECPDEIVTAGERTVVRAAVRLHGGAQAAGLLVDCYVGKAGQTERRKLGSAQVEAVGDRAQVQFSGVFEGGDHWIELRVADDALRDDNAGRLAIVVGEALRVLVVESGDAPAPSRLEGESAFLRAALLARAGDQDRPLDLRVVNRYELSGLRPDEYDAIVLADVPDLPRDAAARLARAVRQEGRGLIVFAGEKTRPEFYNETLGPDVLPARLGLAVTPDGGAEFGFAVEDLDHPVVRFFADPRHRPYLAAPRFRRARRLDLPEVAAAPVGRAVPARPAGEGVARVVLAYQNGQPALVAGQAGRGRVLVFGTDAARGWSDFPLRPAYLMLMRRAVQYVAARRGGAAALRVHEPWTAPVASAAPGAWHRLRTPSGEALPLAAELAPGDEYASVRFDDTRQAGFYRLESSDTAAPGRSFAVNPDPRESDLAALSEADVRARYPGLAFQWVGRGEDVTRVVKQSRTGTEVWPLAIALALLALLAEQVLAALWAPKEV